jgi:hypothetical protein
MQQASVTAYSWVLTRQDGDDVDVLGRIYIASWDGGLLGGPENFG